MPTSLELDATEIEKQGLSIDYGGARAKEFCMRMECSRGAGILRLLGERRLTGIAPPKADRRLPAQ